MNCVNNGDLAVQLFWRNVLPASLANCMASQTRIPQFTYSLPWEPRISKGLFWKRDPSALKHMVIWISHDMGNFYIPMFLMNRDKSGGGRKVPASVWWICSEKMAYHERNAFSIPLSVVKHLPLSACLMFLSDWNLNCWKHLKFCIK
jgi:hypothetical protein